MKWVKARARSPQGILTLEQMMREKSYVYSIAVGVLRGLHPQTPDSDSKAFNQTNPHHTNELDVDETSVPFQSRAAKS